MKQFLLSVYILKIHLLGPLFFLIYCVKVVHISYDIYPLYFMLFWYHCKWYCLLFHFIF